MSMKEEPKQKLAIFFSDKNFNETGLDMSIKARRYCEVNNFNLIDRVFREGDDSCYSHFNKILWHIKTSMNEMMFNMEYLHCDPLILFVEEEICEDAKHLIAWTIIASLKKLNLVKIYILKKDLQGNAVAIDKYDNMINNPMRLVVRSLIELKT